MLFIFSLTLSAFKFTTLSELSNIIASLNKYHEVEKNSTLNSFHVISPENIFLLKRHRNEFDNFLSWLEFENYCFTNKQFH